MPLIAASMLGNFSCGRLIGNNRRPRSGKVYLFVGIALNLAALGYFKYAGFLVQNVNTIAGTDYNLHAIILPLAISFFTFQQIAYLVDSHRAIAEEYKFLHYALFVTFFRQLIAGPIVHHSEMMPQFMRRLSSEKRYMNIAIRFVATNALLHPLRSCVEY